jgi:tetratricopeptide (TPR) repeat protein
LVVADNPRIEELRRRVQKDPASIAFAQLAEEHRRAGDFDEAIQVARTGLAQHPGYLSARVTLGRALLEIGQYDEARSELEQVLRAAPDNLAAIRALAEIHQRLEESGAAAPPPTDAATPTDPGDAGADLTNVFDGSDEQFVHALQALDAFPSELPHDDGNGRRQSAISDPADPILAELEWWLANIAADRRARRGSQDVD